MTAVQGESQLGVLSNIVEGLRNAADALERMTIQNAKQEPTSVKMVLDEYVVGLPCPQNAIDILPGWNHALPPHVSVVAGDGGFFHDTRILWAIEQYGSIEGRNILELGPLEASHTWLIEQHNPDRIDSIEANKLSFLRCLVVKELLKLKKPNFYIGDFTEWLDKTEHRYDFIIASGVLYHMDDPIRLLELIAARTDSFYLWTHYMSEEAMPPGDPRRGALVGAMEIQERHGVSARLYKRSYYGAWRSKAFCGGMHDLHRWVQKDDILQIITVLGFDDVRVAHDEPDHQNGPAFSIFARRTAKPAAIGENELDTPHQAV
jgi:hypothetical protein